MTNPSDELTELLAWLTEHHHQIPRHRQRQAVLALEKVERLVPLSDTQADAATDTSPGARHDR